MSTVLCRPTHDRESRRQRCAWAREAIGANFTSYQVDSLFDLDWATDWDAPDNAYSQSGVADGAYTTGAGGYDEPSGPAVADIGNYVKRLNAWSRKRMHGGTEHWQRMRREATDLINRMKANETPVDFRTMRTNQALVNRQGIQISNRRPDVQMYDSDGRCHIIEVQVTEHDDHFKVKRLEYIALFRQLNMRGSFNGHDIP